LDRPGFCEVTLKKISILDIARMKEDRRKIVMITAYDVLFAKIFDEVGVDVLLVGDSLGQVVLGLPNTLGVTMEDMERHTGAVARGRKRAYLVADMPFLSFQAGPADAIRNAGRLLQAGAEAVKLEGGRNVEATIRAITQCDIPVMGHVGLTPQSIHRMGGYRVQGKSDAQKERLIDDALAVQEGGAFAVVLEGMPADLASGITERLAIPTIGIGAGPGCDGQVLVMQDLLGLFDEFRPKFVKRFGELKNPVREAVQAYADEVREGKFPGKEHSF
jgi:3-methyl-2-oxobutanoate hydroxymethyltransferase